MGSSTERLRVNNNKLIFFPPILNIARLITRRSVGFVSDNHKQPVVHLDGKRECRPPSERTSIDSLFVGEQWVIVNPVSFAIALIAVQGVSNPISPRESVTRRKGDCLAKN